MPNEKQKLFVNCSTMKEIVKLKELSYNCLAFQHEKDDFLLYGNMQRVCHLDKENSPSHHDIGLLHRLFRNKAFILITKESIIYHHGEHVHVRVV